jgi:hypothetical protein
MGWNVCWNEESMGIVQNACSFFVGLPFLWRANWAWGLPMIVLTVTIHVLGIGLMHQKAVRDLKASTEGRHPTFAFAMIMGVATLLIASLHAFEAGLWAAAYHFLGALPDFKSAMLYSLNAITSYGHAALNLEAHWQLLGAIEALNGWLLFGLSAAFLFGLIQRLWLLDGQEIQRR